MSGLMICYHEVILCRASRGPREGLLSGPRLCRCQNFQEEVSIWCSKDERSARKMCRYNCLSLWTWHSDVARANYLAATPGQVSDWKKQASGVRAVKSKSTALESFWTFKFLGKPVQRLSRTSSSARLIEVHPVDPYHGDNEKIHFEFTRSEQQVDVTLHIAVSTRQNFFPQTNDWEDAWPECESRRKRPPRHTEIFGRGADWREARPREKTVWLRSQTRQQYFVILWQPLGMVGSSALWIVSLGPWKFHAADRI